MCSADSVSNHKVAYICRVNKSSEFLAGWRIMCPSQVLYLSRGGMLLHDNTMHVGYVMKQSITV